MNDSDFLEKQRQLLLLCPEADEIGFALKQYLGITFFRYVKSFPNNEKFIICNNETWLKAYFKDKYYNKEFVNYKKHPDDSRGIHIHQPCTRNDPVCNFWRENEKNGDYTSFISFFVKFKNYLEEYNFGLKGDTHQTNDTFFNNQHLFKHFFLYFKSRGHDLLKTAYEARFVVEEPENYNFQENWVLGINDQMTKIVMQEMPLLEIYLDDEYADVAFTLKEARSLKYFLEGYSMQQSAELLDISDTIHVETLANIMGKLQVKSYNELRTLSHQKNITLKLSFLNESIT